MPDGNHATRPGGGNSRIDQDMDAFEHVQYNAGSGGGGDPPGPNLWEIFKIWFARQNKAVVLIGLPVVAAAETALVTIHASIWETTLDIPGIQTVGVPWIGEFFAGWGTFSWIALFCGIATVAIPVSLFTTLFKSRLIYSWREFIADRSAALYFFLCLAVWIAIVLLEFEVFKASLATAGQTPSMSCQLFPGTCQTKTMNKSEIEMIARALMILNGVIGMMTGSMLAKLK